MDPLSAGELPTANIRIGETRLSALTAMMGRLRMSDLSVKSRLKSLRRASANKRHGIDPYLQHAGLASTRHWLPHLYASANRTVVMLVERGVRRVTRARVIPRTGRACGQNGPVSSLAVEMQHCPPPTTRRAGLLRQGPPPLRFGTSDPAARSPTLPRRRPPAARCASSHCVSA